MLTLYKLFLICNNLILKSFAIQSISSYRQMSIGILYFFNNFHFLFIFFLFLIKNPKVYIPANFRVLKATLFFFLFFFGNVYFSFIYFYFNLIYF